MGSVSPGKPMWPQEGFQGRRRLTWDLLPRANRSYEPSSGFGRRGQRSIDEYEEENRTLHGTAKVVPSCTMPGRWNSKPQYSAPCAHAVGSDPLLRDFSWVGHANSSSTLGEKVTEDAGVFAERSHSGYRPAFCTFPFHESGPLTSALENAQQGQLTSSKPIDTVEEPRNDHQNAADLATNESSTEAGAAAGKEQNSSWCCRLRYSETIRAWTDEAWARETAFVLKEEAIARSKIIAQSRADNAAGKTSRVILATQNKGSRASLSLCPLRFTDKSMEAEYAFNQERSARFRNVIAGWLGVFLIFVNAVLPAAAWQAAFFLPDTLVFYSYMTYIVLSILFTVAYANSYRVPFVRRHLEYTSYFIATSAVTIQSVLAFWWKGHLYDEESFLHFAPAISEALGVEFDPSNPPAPRDSVIYHTVVLYNELMLGSFLQSVIFFVCVLFDVLTPTRFFIAWQLQVANTLIAIAPFVYGAFQLPETALPSAACIICILTISASGFVGSYPMEVRRRGLFYEWLSMKRAVASLLEIRRKAQKAAGSSSALDDIRSNCHEVGEILSNIKKGSGNLDVSAGLAHSLTLIQECLFIFATCKNLYLTNVNEELKDESYIKAFNLGSTQARNLLNAESAISSTIGRQSRLGPGGEKLAPVPSDLQSRTGHSGVGELEPQHAALLLPVVGLDLSFNPLEFERSHGEENSSVLLDAGAVLLACVAADWGCDEVVLRNFLVQIDKLYQKQPYHNAKHGTLVAHTMSLLCRTLGLFREMNALGVGSCLVAGLCHDVGHPGRNNNFFVSEMSAVSILFNDASVLENFHSALTFRVLSDNTCDLFALLSDAEAREVRSKIIDLILATDMRTHFEFLNRFRTLRGSDQFNYRKSDEDRWLVAELCIRASDIGHGALSWNQHFEWTGRATTEFYLQGDEESRSGRTMSPLCDRGAHSQLAKSQLGFLRHVVRPLFVELDAIEKQKKLTMDALQNLDENCSRWEVLGETGELIVFPHSVREVEAALRGKPHFLDVSVLTREDGLKCPRTSVKKCKCKCYRLPKTKRNVSETASRQEPSEREEAHQNSDKIKSPRPTLFVRGDQEGLAVSPSVKDAVAGEPRSSSSHGGSLCPVIQVNLAVTPAGNEFDSTASKISLPIQQDPANLALDTSDNGRNAQQSATLSNVEAGPAAGAAGRSDSTQVCSSIIADPELTLARGCKERNVELTAEQHPHCGGEDQAQRDKPEELTEVPEAPSPAIGRTVTIDSEGSYSVPGVDRNFFGF